VIMVASPFSIRFMNYSTITLGIFPEKDPRSF
jgi:hypothetical protein